MLIVKNSRVTLFLKAASSVFSFMNVHGYEAGVSLSQVSSFYRWVNQGPERERQWLRAARR